jgi:hypothetical protein
MYLTSISTSLAVISALLRVGGGRRGEEGGGLEVVIISLYLA